MEQVAAVCSVAEMIEGGYALSELRKAGVSAEAALKAEGVDRVALREAGILGIAEVPRIVPCSREFIASGDYADGNNRNWYMKLGDHGTLRHVDGVEDVGPRDRYTHGHFIFC